MSHPNNLPNPTPSVQKVEDRVADTKPMAQRQDMDTESLDDMAANAGVEVDDDEELHTKEKLDARDENRYLLDPDSGQVSGSDPNAPTEKVYQDSSPYSSPS